MAIRENNQTNAKTQTAQPNLSAAAQALFGVPGAGATPTTMAGAGAQNPNTYRNAKGEEKPKSQFWINPILFMPTTDEQGETVELEVPLPQGIAVDTMNPMSGTTEYANNANSFLAVMQEVFLSMEPGEVRTMRIEGTALGLQFRRTNPAGKQQAVGDKVTQMRNILGLAA